jgi:hypothetical protein
MDDVSRESARKHALEQQQSVLAMMNEMANNLWDNPKISNTNIL